MCTSFWPVLLILRQLLIKSWGLAPSPEDSPVFPVVFEEAVGVPFLDAVADSLTGMQGDLHYLVYQVFYRVTLGFNRPQVLDYIALD